MTIAAMLPGDHDVKLVDMNVESLPGVGRRRRDLILTSSMIVQKDSLEKVIGLCKKNGKKVVAGGPYPTSMNANIPGVDHFVLNEAEVTLPAFLSDYREGKAKPLYSDTAKPDLPSHPPPASTSSARTATPRCPPVLPRLPPLLRVLRHQSRCSDACPEPNRHPSSCGRWTSCYEEGWRVPCSWWTTTSSATGGGQEAAARDRPRGRRKGSTPSTSSPRLPSGWPRTSR